MMQRLNEDFLDALDKEDVIGKEADVESTDGVKDPSEFGFWITLGTHQSCPANTYKPVEIKRRTEQVLNRCPQISAYSKIDAKSDDKTGWTSGLVATSTMDTVREFDDPVSFGFDAQFRNGQQVWRFLNSLRFIFSNHNSIDLSLTITDRTDEVFFLWSDYSTVLEKIEYQHSNPPANYFKKTGIAPEAFRNLCVVMDAMLEGHDPITEADNVLGGVDYSRDFRYNVSVEFASKLCFNGNRNEERVSGRISDIDALFSAHVPIKKILQMRKKYYVFTRICLGAAFANFAVPLLLEPERIKDEYDDYVGLTELEIGSFSVMKLSDRVHTVYECIMYGGHYRNGHGVMTHVALALGATNDVNLLKQFLEDMLPGITFEFIV